MTQLSRGRLVNRTMFSPGYESFATVVAVPSSSAQVIIMCASVSTSKSGMTDSPKDKPELQKPFENRHQIENLLL